MKFLEAKESHNFLLIYTSTEVPPNLKTNFYL